MEALKKKDSTSMISALRKVSTKMKKSGFPLRHLVHDLGKEYVSNAFQDALLSLNAKSRVPWSLTKCPFAERFQKTLQKSIQKYLYDNDTERFIEGDFIFCLNV